MGFLVFDKAVTALAPFIGRPSGNRKHLPVIAMGQIRRDQTSAFFGGFHYNGGFTDSGNNSVIKPPFASTSDCMEPALWDKFD